MNRLPTETRSAALVVLAVVAAVLMLRQARDLFIPIVIAVLLSYALDPVVKQLVRWRVPRSLSAALVVLALVAGACAGAYALRGQVLAVVEDLPEAAGKLRERFAEGRGSRSQGPAEKIQQAAEKLQQTAEDLRPPRARVTPGGALRVQVEQAPFDSYRYLWAGSVGLAYVTLQGVMVIFLVFFLLLSGDLVRRKLASIAGRSASRQRLTAGILEEITAQIGRFLIVRAGMSVLVAVATTLALWWLGVQQAAFWGILAGVFNTIEYFGPVLVSGGLAIVGFLQFGTLSMALASAGVALVITSLEGWLLTPPLLGRATRMNAIAVFVGLLFWGWVWGPLGLLLAVPLMAVVKAVCDRVEALRSFGELLGE